MSDTVDRVVTPEFADADQPESNIRPQTLSAFIGQKSVRENLAVFINAAKTRGEALDLSLIHI